MENNDLAGMVKIVENSRKLGRGSTAPLSIYYIDIDVVPKRILCCLNFSLGESVSESDGNKPIGAVQISKGWIGVSLVQDIQQKSWIRLCELLEYLRDLGRQGAKYKSHCVFCCEYDILKITKCLLFFAHSQTLDNRMVDIRAKCVSIHPAPLKEKQFRVNVHV